jgi:hypothetical protein
LLAARNNWGADKPAALSPYPGRANALDNLVKVDLVAVDLVTVDSNDKAVPSAYVEGRNNERPDRHRHQRWLRAAGDLHAQSNRWETQITLNDPIVEEIRKIRDEHAARFNYDLDAIFLDIKESEKELGLPLITLPPNRAA